MSTDYMTELQVGHTLLFNDRLSTNSMKSGALKSSSYLPVITKVTFLQNLFCASALNFSWDF